MGISLLSFLLILIFIIVLLIQGFFIVPDDQVWLISFLGNRPQKGVNPQHIVGSGFLTSGPHWFLLKNFLHKFIEPMHSVPFNSYLFRHDGSVEGKDMAKVELQNMIITLKATAIAKISDNSNNLEDYWKAHYIAAQQDYVQQTELILNSYVKTIFQGQIYERDKNEQAEFLRNNPSYQADDFEVTGISNIKQDRLYKELGLQKVNNILVPTPGSQIGSEIVNKLRESGLCLMELFIVDINPPESIDKAREERGRLSAEQNAKLDATKIQYEIVKEQNKNLIESKIGEAIALRTQRIGEAKALRTQKLGEAKALRVQRTGEAKALLIQSKGIIEAILEENTGSGGSISEQELFNILSKYPAVAEVLGDKAKFFFQGGGDGLNIVSQIIAALDSSKDG